MQTLLTLVVLSAVSRMTLIEGTCTVEAAEVLSLVRSGNSKALAVLLQSKSPPLEELNAIDSNGRVSEVLAVKVRPHYTNTCCEFVSAANKEISGKCIFLAYLTTINLIIFSHK